MAFLESAVVIYARLHFYPEGFAFPLKPMDSWIVTVELFRELATMVMLLAPAALFVRTAQERFAWFCFSFGVWDIFYYVFLKAALDWPSGFLDWDILFLVPVVWVGPVLAPCLVALGMIMLGLIVARNARSGQGPSAWSWKHVAGLASAGAIVLFTFIEEPSRHAVEHAGMRALLVVPAPGHQALEALAAYRPTAFCWWLFLTGCSVAAAVILDLSRRRS